MDINSQFLNHTKDVNADFWENKWKKNQTGWDIGYASPALVSYFEQKADWNARILIPGCGNAYEAEALALLGYTDITLVDISKTLTDKLKEKYNNTPAIKVVNADFFQLQEQFDYIIEQTFFCALDPSLREDYVAKMARLLKQNGQLVGLLFDRDFGNPFPPFGGDLTEYETLFKPHFNTRKFEKCTNSIPARAGTELLFTVCNCVND